MPNDIKLAIDKKVFGWEFLQQLNWLSVTPVNHIDDIDQADALIISTQFKMSTEQLKQKNIRWLGLASSGMDHIDPYSLREHNIHYYVAKGCNANAVAEYVTAVIAKYSQQTHIHCGELSLGIIGFGPVGQAVNSKLGACMQQVKWCDPLYQNANDYAMTYAACLECDVVSLHCSLTSLESTEQKLDNQNLLSYTQVNASNIKLLINAARGEILHPELVQANLDTCRLAADTHRSEPLITIQNNQYWLTSPHIAGQTFLSRVNSLAMLLIDLTQWYKTIIHTSGEFTFDVQAFNQSLKRDMVPNTPTIAHQTQSNLQQIEQFGLPVDLLNSIIDLRSYHSSLIDQPSRFNILRKQYLRHEFADYADIFMDCKMQKLLAT